MGTINNKFFEELANKATWSAGVAFKRSNPLPIDKYSVFETIALAEEYAATSAVAYPGQVVAAMDATAGKMVVYVLTEVATLNENGEAVLDDAGNATYHLELDRVGIVPAGDGKSIQVTANGVISLLGVESADSLTLPRMKADKSGIEWVPVSQVVEGDGNDNTTYEFTPVQNDAEETYGIKIKPLFNGQPVKGDDEQDVVIEIPFDVYTKSEVDSKIDEAIGEYTNPETFAPATGVRAEIEALIGGENALSTDKTIMGAKAYTDFKVGPLAKTADVNSALELKADKSTTYTKTEVDNALALRANAADVYTKTEVDGAINTAVEGILGEGVSEAYDTLVEIQKILEGTDGEKIDGLVETVADNKSKIETLNGDAETAGSVAHAVAAEATRATGVEEGLASRIDDLAAIDNATQEELDAYKGEVTIALAGKVSNGDFDSYKNGVADALSKKANTANVYAKGETYSADEIDELLENIQAGSSESAASVNTKLEKFQKAINLEVYGNEDGTGDSRIDALEAIGAEANKIDAVKAREGVTESGPSMLTVTTENKVVTIDDSAIASAIASNRKSVETLSTSVTQQFSTVNSNIDTNASNIEALTGRMTTAEGNINTNAGAIAALDTRVSAAEGKIGTLETSVTGKADQTSLNALSQALGTTNGTITTLTERVAADETILAGKLKTSDFNNIIAGYYTKSEVYSKDEANAAFIAASRDAELVALIGDASNAAAAAHGAADTIYKNVEGVESGVLVTKLANYKTSAETDTAIAEAVAAIDHLKKRIVDSVNADGQPVVDGEVIAIDPNTIYMVHVDTATGDQYKEYMLVGERLVLIGDTSIDLADYITSGELTGELAKYVASENLSSVAVTSITLGEVINKQVGDVTIPYADVRIPGLAAADGVTLGANGKTGVLEVKAVSTDLLTQGENELILIGGSASN